MRGGQRGLALQLSTGLYGDGIPFDWSGERTFKLRRLANGDGQIEFAGNIEIVQHDRLASSSRADASFAFGCFLDAAAATATFGPIGMPVFPMTITPAYVVLVPNRIEGVALNGSFELDPASDGIDPVGEGVTLELSTPAETFYPVGADAMPVSMRTIRGGWGITDAERARTGIDFFMIQRTANPRRFQYVLLDGHSDLPAADYSQVSLHLEIGDDQGSVNMNLNQGRRATGSCRNIAFCLASVQSKR